MAENHCSGTSSPPPVATWMKSRSRSQPSEKAKPMATRSAAPMGAPSGRAASSVSTIRRAPGRSELSTSPSSPSSMARVSTVQ